jgi:hypothetical protein
MRALAILTAAAALAGCNQLGIGGNAANNGSAANQAAGNAAADGKDSGGNQVAGSASAADDGKLNAGGGAIPAAANGIVLDRTYLLGRWADFGDDCSRATEVTADGRFLTPAGDEALWNLEGSEMTMSGNAQTITMRIVPVDQDTITVVNQDGSLGRSTRC